MSLIYSRPRIKLPKFLLFKYNKRNNSRNKKMRFLLLFFILITIISVVIIKAVTPVFNQICIDKAKSIATIITNEETTNSIKGYKYSDFIIIHKDDKGNILMLELNMINVNLVISDVANRIQVRLDNIEREDIKISLGSFSGISMLSGRGYQVPIRISTIGNVQTRVKSEFIEKGINQTLHRLYLEIESEVSILTPFNTIKRKIINQFIIGENVIVGDIPEAYYNLDGINENDIIEVIE